jgi:cell division protease FtsH
MLGGRASEQMMLGTRTTGAADDLTQTTNLARRMVGQWGMSDKLRHLAFQESDTEVFLGEQISQRRQYSEETAREIDIEVKRLIDACYDDVEQLLQDNRARVQALADALDRDETVEGETLRSLMEDHAPSRDGGDDQETADGPADQPTDEPQPAVRS